VGNICRWYTSFSTRRRRFGGGVVPAHAGASDAGADVVVGAVAGELRRGVLGPQGPARAARRVQVGVPRSPVRLRRRRVPLQRDWRVSVVMFNLLVRSDRAALRPRCLRRSPRQGNVAVALQRHEWTAVRGRTRGRRSFSRPLRIVSYADEASPTFSAERRASLSTRQRWRPPRRKARRSTAGLSDNPLTACPRASARVRPWCGGGSCAPDREAVSTTGAADETRTAATPRRRAT
jgi:hypothetical protein